MQLNRKGLKASHRPGYVAVADGLAGTQDAEAALMDAVDNPLDSTGVGLKVSAEGANLRICVDAPAITLTPVADRWKGELLLAVVREGRDQPLVQRVGIDLSRQRYDEVMKEGAMFPQSITPDDLARGVRVFVVDVASRRVGSVNVRQ